MNGGPLIDAKVWVSMQARAQLAGLQLLRSEGAAVVVVLIDRSGKPHRVHTIEQIEDVLLAAEFSGAVSTA